MRNLLFSLLMLPLSMSAYADKQLPDLNALEMVAKSLQLNHVAAEGCKANKARSYLHGLCKGMVAYSVNHAKKLNLCIPDQMKSMTTVELSYIVGSSLSKRNDAKADTIETLLMNTIDDLFKCE